MLQDSFIRDRTVYGTHCTRLRERLLCEYVLTLDKCLLMSRAMQIFREHTKTIKGQTVEEVHGSPEENKDRQRCQNFVQVLWEDTLKTEN